MRRLTLRLRLFLSYAFVVVVGAAVMTLVVELVGRELFDRRMAGLGYAGGRRSGMGLAELQSAFGSALTRALLLALAVSLAAAVVTALFVARRLLRPVEAIRRAVHRLAAGSYGEEVAEPAEPELAALVGDVNLLARSLATTEQRRAALIGDVAHEMRTPLTSLRGYTDGLADGLFAPEEVLVAMGTELARLERLASDLAAVSRAEEGGVSLRVAGEDLCDIARAVAARLQPQYADGRVGLHVSADGAVPVTVDRDRIVQALTNLLGNALTYTPAGGEVRLTVTATPDGRAKVCVADTGRGLAPEDLQRVFERFYRVDPHGRAGGSGVGLTIARAIARAHGGELTASSAGRGRGSAFELVLPLGGPPGPGLAGPAAARAADHG